MSVESLMIVLEAQDNATRSIQAVAQSIERLQRFSGNMRDLGQAVSDFGGGMVRNVTLPIVAGLGEAARVAVEFESVMSDLNKAYGFASGTEEAEAAQQVVKGLSLELGRLPTDVAAIGTEAGKLGVKFDQFEDYTQLVTQASVAFDMTAQQAGESIGVITNVLGYMDDAGRVNIEGLSQLGDTINYLADSGATSESAIISVLQRAGGTTRSFGLASESAAALAASFLNLGYPPEVVGTALNGMLPQLQNATQQSGKFQKALEDIGLPAAELEKLIAEDAAGAFGTLLQTIADSGDSSIISKLFGNGSDASMMRSMVENLGLFERTMGSLENVDPGSMMDTFAKRSATTAAQLEKLRAASYILRNEIGAAMLPAIVGITQALTPLVQKFATFAEAHPGIVQIGLAIAGILAVIGPVAVAIGSVISAIGTISGALAALKGVMLVIASSGGFGAIFAPILALGWPAIAVIAAIAAAGALIVANWGAVKAFLAGFWEGFTAALAPVLPMLQQFGMAMQSAFSTLLQMAGSIFSITGSMAGLGAGFGTVSISAQAFGAAVGAAVGGVVRSIAMAVAAIMRAIGAFGALGAAGAAAGARMAAGIQSGASGALGAIRAMASGIIGTLSGLAGRAFSAGAQIVQRIAAGIRSGIGAVTGAISSVGAAIAAALPGSPVDEGPLTVLNNIASNPGAKIVEMLASGMAAAAPAMSGAMGSIGGGAVGGLNVPPAVSGGAASGPVNITVQVQGVSNAAEAETIGDSFAQRVRQVLIDVERSKARVSYG